MTTDCSSSDHQVKHEKYLVQYQKWASKQNIQKQIACVCVAALLTLIWSEHYTVAFCALKTKHISSVHEADIAYLDDVYEDIYNADNNQ